MKNLKKYIISFITLLLMISFMQSCEFADKSIGDTSGSGTGGSMARFTIVDNHLFTVDNRDLKVFDVTQSESPESSDTYGRWLD